MGKAKYCKELIERQINEIIRDNCLEDLNIEIKFFGNTNEDCVVVCLNEMVIRRVALIESTMECEGLNMVELTMIDISMGMLYKLNKEALLKAECYK